MPLVGFFRISRYILKPKFGETRLWTLRYKVPVPSLYLVRSLRLSPPRVISHLTPTPYVIRAWWTSSTGKWPLSYAPPPPGIGWPPLAVGVRTRPRDYPGRFGMGVPRRRPFLPGPMSPPILFSIALQRSDWTERAWIKKANLCISTLIHRSASPWSCEYKRGRSESKKTSRTICT